MFPLGSTRTLIELGDIEVLDHRFCQMKYPADLSRVYQSLRRSTFVKYFVRSLTATNCQRPCHSVPVIDRCPTCTGQLFNYSCTGTHHCGSVAGIEYVKFPGVNKSAAQAHELCRRSFKHGQVAWPRNENENKCLKDFHSSSAFWLGIWPDFKARIWNNPDLQPITWQNFAPGQPDSHFTQCGEMLHGGNGKWDDVDCNDEKPFICQRAVMCHVTQPKFGNASKLFVHYPDSVQYTCDTGYWLDGPTTANCTSDGTLTTTPKCKG
ncbi:neurocan core protein-like [Sycon ciliatum]|uniref:neurocan core protein-like n=1 Tax=Sycon ciliatum TaxID=27933 RepID=UPI0031F60BB4